METERRERGRYRRREGGKETGEKQRGRDIRKETERKKHRRDTKDQDTGGGGEERKEGMYRGETMESDRVEK